MIVKIVYSELYRIIILHNNTITIPLISLLPHYIPDKFRALLLQHNGTTKEDTANRFEQMVGLPNRTGRCTICKRMKVKVLMPFHNKILALF